MPETGRAAAGANRQSYREAIAQWRLALHTEVKRCSSLPTAMFDACDPMLETRLAETAETMLACLQVPPPELAAPKAAAGELRLEQVSQEEMRRLPAQLAAEADAPLDLQDGLAAEYLAVLADTCCHGNGPAQQHAVLLLCRDFGLSAATDLSQLTLLLAAQVRGALDPGADEGRDSALSATCARVAGALALHAPAAEGARERA